MPSTIVWPDWMPAPQQDSFSIQPEDRRLTSETESGNVIRYQFDTDILVADCTLILNGSQARWFATFERDVLRQGSVWFEFPIWEDGGVEWEMCRFKTRPKAGSLIGLHTTYTFSLYVSKRNSLYGPCIMEMLDCWSPCESASISDSMLASIAALDHSTSIPVCILEMYTCWKVKEINSISASVNAGVKSLNGTTIIPSNL